jgi:pilus assembly protein CpaB
MRSKLILIMALIMGAVTTYLFFDYMKQFDKEKVMTEATVNVVVASQNIQTNQRITSGMLQVVAKPKTGLHPQTVMNISEIEGKFSTSNLTSGEIVLSHHMKEEKDENVFVSRKVSEGFRAVSIGLNFVQSVSNLIEPEDYVDVIFSETIDNGQQKQTNTSIILQKARVLAIGRKMIPSNGPEEYVEYSSVTLELKSNDAVKLVNATERGNIQLVLHTRIKPPKEVAENAEQSQ